MSTTTLGTATIRRWKRYPAYSDSSTPMVGPVPTGWSVLPLKYLVQPTRRITYGIVQCGEDDPDGIAYIRPVNMSDEGGVDPDCLRKTAREIAAAYARSTVRPGDLVVSIGPSFGKVMIVPPQLDGANLTQGTARVAPRPEIFPRFLFWALRAEYSRCGWDAACGGATFRALTLQTLSNNYVVIPSDYEQRAIAAFLDRETARIDALVGHKERLITLLEEKRQAVISHAVTRGLNPNATLKDSGIPWLGNVPKHWSVKQLRYIIRPGTMITYGIVQAGPEIPDGIPYIRTSDMSGEELPREGYLRTSPEIDESYRRSRVYEGDIVIAIRATVGKALPVPAYLDGANLTQGTAKISPGEGVDRDYLLWALRSCGSQQRFEALAKGATFREITLDMLRRFSVACPPVNEQRQIAAHLNRLSEHYGSIIRRIRDGVACLQEYRTALISAAVTGQIDVRGEVTEDVS